MHYMHVPTMYLIHVHVRTQEWYNYQRLDTLINRHNFSIEAIENNRYISSCIYST